MTEFKCDGCNKRFKTSQALSQHKDMKHSSASPKTSNTGVNKSRTGIMLGIIIVLIIVLGSFVAIGGNITAGEFDNFAKCLTEKNIVVYGNDWCKYTQRQTNLFGNSFQYINYLRCDDNKNLCDQKGVSITPAWEINGKIYQGVQDLKTLGELSGCGA